MSESKADHVSWKWCDDLHCMRCYGPDVWQHSRISQLERDRAELIEALQTLVNLFHGYQGLQMKEARALLARLKVQP